MYDVQAEDHHFLVFSRVRLVAKPRYSTRGPWLMIIPIQSKKIYMFIVSASFLKVNKKFLTTLLKRVIVRM